VPVGPGYQVPFATRIRNEAQIPTAAVGLITEPMQANQIIVDGLADAVMMGREFLRNPRWPLFAAAELGAEVNWPPQLIRGKR
jgi:2,4-dienoyl-CoA reductase-like NADH-dependent reductase (Old Yellow Enzyme family)